MADEVKLMVTVVVGIVILVSIIGVLYHFGYDLEDAKIAFNKALLNMPTSENKKIAGASVAALACAIDAVAYEQAHPNNFGMHVLDNCNGTNLPSSVEINPDPPTAATKIISFTHTGSTHTIKLNCDSALDKCNIEDFHLPQEISGNWHDWIEGAGNPHYLVYNSALPKHVNEDWQIPGRWAVAESAVFGALLGVFSVPGIGKKVLTKAGVAINKLPLGGKLTKYFADRSGATLTKSKYKDALRYVSAGIHSFSKHSGMKLTGNNAITVGVVSQEVKDRTSNFVVKKMIKYRTKEGLTQAQALTKVKQKLRDYRYVILGENPGDGNINQMVKDVADAIEPDLDDLISKSNKMVDDVVDKGGKNVGKEQAMARIKQTVDVAKQMWDYPGVKLQQSTNVAGIVVAKRNIMRNEVIENIYEGHIYRAKWVDVGGGDMRWAVEMTDGVNVGRIVLDKGFAPTGDVLKILKNQLNTLHKSEMGGIAPFSFKNNAHQIYGAMRKENSKNTINKIYKDFVGHMGEKWSKLNPAIKKLYRLEKEAWEYGGIAQKYAMIEMSTNALDDLTTEIDVTGDWKDAHEVLESGIFDGVPGFLECCLFFKNTKKGKLYCGSLVAAGISMHVMDIEKAAFEPVEMNSLNLHLFGNKYGDDNPIVLSDEANKFFLQVFGDGVIFENYNRLWLASPCRTDLQVYAVLNSPCDEDKHATNALPGLAAGTKIALENVPADYLKEDLSLDPAKVTTIEAKTMLTKVCNRGMVPHPYTTNLIRIRMNQPMRDKYKDKMKDNYCTPIYSTWNFANGVIGFATAIALDIIGVVAAPLTMGASVIICGAAGSVAYDHITAEYWPDG
ncbi:MAG: hypothetical protein KAQ92_09010 [Candidatus Aenigmarchaeota archaeon]|nr:hypothetical protein [Candidatus Aenigmarchaeota archaeon]